MRNLLSIKDGDQSVREEPTSPDFTLALGKLVYDQMPVSEVRPVNVAEEEEKEADEDKEKDSRPMSWRVKNPVVPSALAPAPARD